MSHDKVLFLGGGVNVANTNIWTGQNTFNKAPIVPRTDLGAISNGSSNALALQTYYQGTTAVAAFTITFSGTPAEGSTVSLKLLATAVTTVTIPSCKRLGEVNAASTTCVVWPGNHILSWVYINGEYLFSDTLGPLNNLAATAAPTVNDDTGDGYQIGSRWVDVTNDNEYVCTDATLTAALWKWTNPLLHYTWAFNPKAVCDGTIDRLFLMTVGPAMPSGFIVYRWNLSFDADPVTEAVLNLKRADAYIGVANAAIMDVLDTTAGVSSETTAANINGGAAVANGKVIYLEFGVAYTTDLLQCVFELWGRAVV